VQGKEVSRRSFSARVEEKLEVVLLFSSPKRMDNHGLLIGPQELDTLLSLLAEDQKTFESISAKFKKVFVRTQIFKVGIQRPKIEPA
jgi:hypothetical protein